MKKSLFSLVVVFAMFTALFSSSAFAYDQSGNYTISNLADNDSNYPNKYYMKVNSAGSVSVSFHNMTVGYKVGVKLYNSSTGNWTTQKVAELPTTNFVEFTNLKSGNYVIEVTNLSGKKISGTCGYAWDGSLGPWIE
ncbi:hypothetical protein D3C73_697450 [compost metagenome]